MSFDGSGVSSKDTRVVWCSFSGLGCQICPLLAVILLPLLPLVIAARISVILRFMLLDTGTVIDDRREVYGVVVIGYQTLYVVSTCAMWWFCFFRRHKEDIKKTFVWVTFVWHWAPKKTSPIGLYPQKKCPPQKVSTQKRTLFFDLKWIRKPLNP